MNTEHLKLFTPIENNRIPLDINSDCIVRSEVDNTGLSVTVIIHVCQVKNGTVFYNAKLGDNVKHTHWLDFSKNTSLERAICFAEDAYLEGSHNGSVTGVIDYIQQNKNKL